MPGDPRPTARCAEALVRAFAFLGKRWNGQILATLGQGPASFSELSRAVSGISDSVLSERLAELVDVGLVCRTVGPGRPVSVVYTLTPPGEALVPVLAALTDWAERHLPAGVPRP